jgi:hypothetical protein
MKVSAVCVKTVGTKLSPVAELLLQNIAFIELLSRGKLAMNNTAADSLVCEIIHLLPFPLDSMLK